MSDPSYCANTQIVDIDREVFRPRRMRAPVEESEMIPSLSRGRAVHWTSLGVAGVVAFSVTPSGEVEALSVI